jgi:hypothetical protein
MAILNFNPMAYLKYFTLNSPMIIGAFIILSSAFNQDIKGVLFMTGATIMMFIGQFFSSSLDRKVPKNADLAACTMFSSSGWGFKYSAPGPDALFLSFVATYLIFGMAAHSNYNWILLGALLIIVTVNAFFRVKLLNCGEPIDILFGWAFGIIGAVIWYGMMAAAESTSQGTMSLTYFGDESGVNQCKITNKKFKCKKL